MRRLLALSTLGVLAGLPACTTTNYQGAAPTPPVNVAIFLRSGPVTGGCAAVTLPQVAVARPNDAIAFHVVNISCPSGTTVAVDFKGRRVVELEQADPGCEALKAAYPKGSEATVCFQRKGRVVGAPGRYKYIVKVSSGFEEDPDIEIWPPPPPG